MPRAVLVPPPSKPSSLLSLLTLAIEALFLAGFRVPTAPSLLGDSPSASILPPSSKPPSLLSVLTLAIEAVSHRWVPRSCFLPTRKTVEALICTQDWLRNAPKGTTMFEAINDFFDMPDVEKL